MVFYNILSICLYLLLAGLISSKKTEYDLLLEWGKNNSLEISDKIQIEYINENNKTFSAKNTIQKGEEILNIPNSILLNIENTLILYGTKAKKLYSSFKSELNKLNETSNFTLEQPFLAYIMYKVNKNKKSKKNKFYKHFQYLFNTYESNLDSFPIFYSLEQLNLIRQTSLGFLIDRMKKLYDEEIAIYENILKEKKINKEDYYVFRTYSSSKSFNISGHSVIIPFLDIFEKHPTKYNIEVIASDYDIKVISTNDISPSDKLFIKSDTLSNHNALLYFGISFEEIIDRIENYYIPILNPLLIKNNNIEIKEDPSLSNYFSNYIEIKRGNNDFYLKYIDTYKKLCNKFEMDETELSAYHLILHNLITLKEMNEQINIYAYNVFYTKKDVNNILNIIKTENNALEEKIDLIKFLIDGIKKDKKEKKEDEDINFDL